MIARGHGDRVDDALEQYGGGLSGLRVAFDYGASGFFDEVAARRREAERDAGEVLAVARDLAATRAVGGSRGARAIVGAMAEQPDVFERVVLVAPPGGTAAGGYRSWLAAGAPGRTATVLVLAVRGDGAHPVQVANEWAVALGAELEVVSKLELAEPRRLTNAIARFLDD